MMRYTLAVLFLTIIFISLAIAWERYEGNPVLSPGEPWCYGALSDPDIIAVPGGGFYMVYSAAGVDSGSYTTLTRPGAAWSPDGFTWTMSDRAVITNGVPGTWDSAAVETPAILFEGDSIILMYVGDWAHGAWEDMALGMAISHDGGVTYTRKSDHPVFEKDTSRHEEYYWIESPSLLRIGDSLVMWYNGVSSWGHIVVNRATSIDGIQWNRCASNPVMEVGEPGSFDDIGVYSPCVRPLGDSLCMLYQGYMAGDTSWIDFDSACLGWATSTDNGITWRRFPGNPILGPGPAGAWDENGVVTPSFCFNGDQIIAVYWNGGSVDVGGQLGIVTHSLTGIKERAKTIDKYHISCYPNPFNSCCRISSPGNAKITMFDLDGRAIAELNSNCAIWEPVSSVSSGIYFVRANLGDKWSQPKKVVYLK
ncbi:T9SS type A sorting domain-containing protein [bacterium]|nr:T9SS type A sorting domain-containing protein [bacterium]